MSTKLRLPIPIHTEEYALRGDSPNESTHEIWHHPALRLYVWGSSVNRVVCEIWVTFSRAAPRADGQDGPTTKTIAA